MAASTLKRRISDDEREEANKATQSQLEGIFSSFSNSVNSANPINSEKETRLPEFTSTQEIQKSQLEDKNKNAISESTISENEFSKNANLKIDSKTENSNSENVVNLVLPKKEKKDRRVQLIMKESVYNKTKEKAEKIGMSLNDYIHTLLENLD